MTLQTQQPTPDNSPAVLTDEQRRRVADALENAQSENTRRNYAGQYRKFSAWCEREEQFPLPTSPEVVAAYAAELVDDGKSMSTVRLAVSAIVDAHRRVGLESPVNAGVTETLWGLARRVGASQRQAKPLDADALAAISATAFTPRRSRGGSLESDDTALKRGRLDIALASVLSDAGLVYMERSKTDQTGEGAYVAITPETLVALKQLRQDSSLMSDADAPVFELSMSQISRRVDSLAIRMTRRGAPLQAVQTHGRWKSPQMPARYTRGEKALEALEWL